MEKQDFEQKACRMVGLLLPMAGSANHELDITGFYEDDIGNWKTETDQSDSQYVHGKVEDSIEFVAHGE